MADLPISLLPATTNPDGEVAIVEGGITKKINAKAYTEDLIGNPTVGLPGPAGLFVGQMAQDTANGDLYSWDGAAWNLNPAASGGDELVKVSANDTTPGVLNGKLTQGTNMVLTENNDGGNETFDVAVSATPSFTTVTTDNLIVNTQADFVTAIINYDASVQNFTGTPNQISCEVAPLFATPFTAPALTQYAEVKIEYDNTVDAVVAKTIRTILDGNTQTIPFETATDTGEITVSWAAGDITVTIASGTPGFFSFAVVDPLCYYNGVSENNYTDKIHTLTNNITENIDSYESNVGGTVVYDSTSTVVNNGDATFNNVTVNGTLTGAGTSTFLGSDGGSVNDTGGGGGTQNYTVPVGTREIFVYHNSNSTAADFFCVTLRDDGRTSFTDLPNAGPGPAGQIRASFTWTVGTNDFDIDELSHNNVGNSVSFQLYYYSA